MSARFHFHCPASIRTTELSFIHFFLVRHLQSSSTTSSSLPETVLLTSGFGSGGLTATGVRPHAWWPPTQAEGRDWFTNQLIAVFRFYYWPRMPIGRVRGNSRA